MSLREFSWNLKRFQINKLFVSYYYFSSRLYDTSMPSFVWFPFFSYGRILFGDIRFVTISEAFSCMLTSKRLRLWLQTYYLLLNEIGFWTELIENLKTETATNRVLNSGHESRSVFFSNPSRVERWKSLKTMISRLKFLLFHTQSLGLLQTGIETWNHTWTENSHRREKIHFIHNPP